MPPISCKISDSSSYALLWSFLNDIRVPWNVILYLQFLKAYRFSEFNLTVSNPFIVIPFLLKFDKNIKYINILKILNINLLYLYLLLISMPDNTLLNGVLACYSCVLFDGQWTNWLIDLLCTIDAWEGHVIMFCFASFHWKLLLKNLKKMLERHNGSIISKLMPFISLSSIYLVLL